MAVRNWLTDIWRAVSLRHGFAEYDGPIFEYLDLYTAKSGQEIVEQLFHLTDRGGRKLAIRPEMTPTLARMIHRGDVKEGETISVRRLSLQELAEGKFGFSERVTSSGDIRSMTGTVPPEALAAGRVLVEFTDKPEPSTFPDMAKYRKDSVIASSTGQLAWDTSGKGFFTVNTDGTKAVVGFAEGKEIALGNVTIQLQCPYASIFLTAIEKDATLANAKSALISAVARNCNTGFTVLTLDNRVLENGKGPILLEPVKARITISGRPVAAVYVLDHDGRRTDRLVPLLNDSFILDGARDKAIYYEVQFK
jgi:hypothetical protein